MKTKILLLTVIVIAASTMFIFKDESTAPGNSASSSPAQTTPPTAPTPSGVSVSKTGKPTCLTLRNPGELQDMSCAIGFEANDGKTYVITSDDPAFTGSLATGQEVTVTGILADSVGDERYNAEGTIHVISVQK